MTNAELGPIAIVVFKQLETGRQIRPLLYSSMRRMSSLGVRNFAGRRAAQVGHQERADSKSRIRRSRETRPRTQIQEEFCFRTDFLARLWRDSNGVYRAVSGGTPACLGFAECFLKRSRFYL